MSELTSSGARMSETDPTNDDTHNLTTTDWIGLVVLGLMFLGGLWLMTAAFIVGYQPRTSQWTDGTISTFVIGGSVTVLALTAAVTSAATTLFGLSRAINNKTHPQTQTNN